MESNDKIIGKTELSVRRRKRIKNIKIFIVTMAIILLVLPTIICMVLLLKIDKLEKQMDLITQANSKEYVLYSEKKDTLKNGNVVYAAEKSRKTKDSNSNNDQMKESEEQSDTKADKDTNKASDKVTDAKTEESQSVNNKRVYLTFDDGPSEHTNKVLDILDKYHVKATFFVIGKTDDASVKIYQRIVKEGHTLGMHSFSHDYNYIYSSKKNFVDDFTKISDLLYNVTGIRPKYYRFPGGSSNTVCKLPMTTFISYLNEKKISYFDWNVENGDATGKEYSIKQLNKNIMDGVSQHHTSIILMHDTKDKPKTLKALPKLIEELQKEDYTILPIDDSKMTIQHIKSENVTK
jgi:Predicted xylanase/chitin deacetylase